MNQESDPYFTENGQTSKEYPAKRHRNNNKTHKQLIWIIR